MSWENLLRRERHFFAAQPTKKRTPLCAERREILFWLSAFQEISIWDGTKAISLKKRSLSIAFFVSHQALTKLAPPSILMI